MRYLKELAVQVIRERTRDDQFNASDIQWVLTVPAIWKPAAKQFMREAAYEVRYYSEIDVLIKFYLYYSITYNSLTF